MSSVGSDGAASEGRFKRIGEGCSLVVLSLGLWGLGSWMMQRPILTSFFPEWWPMSPKGALAFVLLGSALSLQFRRPGSEFGRYWNAGAMGLLLLLCTWNFLETFTSFRLGIEERFFRVPSGLDYEAVFRMSKLTFFCVLPAGAAVLQLGWRPGWRLATWIPLFGVTMAALSAVTLFGYGYGAPQLYGAPFRPAGITTALATLFLGLALIAAGGPHEFPVRYFVGPSVAARLARVCVPALLVVLMTAHIVSSRLRGRTSDVVLEGALHTLASVAIVGAVALWMARRTGRKLDQAEQALREARDELELQVQERTAALQETGATLRASEERLRYALQGATDGLWDWDLATNQIYYSPRWKEMLGYREEEVEPHPGAWTRLAHPEDRDQALRAMAAVRAGRTSQYEAEFRMRHKDGHWVHVLSRGALVRDAQGNPVRLVGTHVDITPRKQAEDALRRSEHLMRLTWDCSLDGMRLADSDGRIVMVNDAFCRLMQISHAELKGQSISAPYLPERHAEILGKYCQRFRDRSMGIHQETEVTLRSGQQRVFELSNSFVEMPDQPDLLLSVFRDITARRQAETEFREQGEKLRLALQATGMATWDWDVSAGTIQYSENTPSIARGENIEPYSTVNGLLQEVHPEDRKNLARAIEQTTSENRPFDCEYRVRMQDGIYHWIHGKGAAVSVVGGKPVRLLGVSQDITERKLAEEALRASEERHRMLEDHTEDFVSLEDLEGKHLYVSPSYWRVTGWTPQAVESTDWRTRMHPEDLAQIETCKAASRAGRTTVFEHRIRCRDGRWIWVEQHCKPIANAGGQMHQMLLWAHDITARKQTEFVKEAFLLLGAKLNAVQTPAEAARAILTTADGLWRWDCATLDVYVPEANRMEPVLNLDTVDGQRREVPSAYGGGPPTPRMCRIMEQGAELILRPSAGTAAVTDSLMFGDASRPSASLMCVPVHWEGRSVGVLSIQSYTPNAYTREDLRMLQSLADYCGGALERLRAGEALRLSEERFRTLFESAPVGIALIRPDGAWLQANRAYHTMFGYSSDELAQTHFPELVPPTDVTGVAGVFQDLCEGRREHDVGERSYRHKHGHAVWSNSALAAIRGPDGRLRYILAVEQNLTEQRRLEREVIEISSKERRRIGYEIHDELGAFLGGVALKAKMLQEDLSNTSPQLVAEAKQLVSLVNEAIAQTRRLARGLDPVEVEAGDLGTALSRLVSETNALRNVTCVLLPEPPSLRLDPQVSLSLYRVAQEAINNALRHGQARRIELECTLGQREFQLTIRDDGTGISPDQSRDTGMGLRIMRHRIHSVGGQVTIRSLEGRGTEVQCRVPLPLAPAQSSPATPDQSS